MDGTNFAAAPGPIETEVRPTAPPARGLGGLRRLGATALLGARLLAVGGVAVVNAASLSPSASPGAIAGRERDDTGCTRWGDDTGRDSAPQLPVTLPLRRTRPI